MKVHADLKNKHDFLQEFSLKLGQQRSSADQSGVRIFF